jgi:hypothetical protein
MHGVTRAKVAGLQLLQLGRSLGLRQQLEQGKRNRHLNLQNKIALRISLTNSPWEVYWPIDQGRNEWVEECLGILMILSDSRDTFYPRRCVLYPK